jgi:phosphoglycerate-specific signal transduction histidine kinase
MTRKSTTKPGERRQTKNMRRPLAPAPDHPLHDLIATQWETFLSELRRGTSISGAAGYAGFSRAEAYRRMKATPEAQAAVDDAIEHGTDILVDHVRNRVTSPEKPSDLLSIFILKSRRPEVFRDTYTHKVEVTDNTDAKAQMRQLLDSIKARQLASLQPPRPLQIEDATLVEDDQS